MIDVIIPAYNAYDTIEVTLKSIEKQTIKDKIKVYIIDDASDKDYDYLINKFNFDITIYKLNKNGGPGVARQYGINHSNNDYLVFIDADDIFTNENSLKILLDTIEDKDVGVTRFIEDINGSYLDKYKDDIWMHGKIYKRKYIKDNNIHFNTSRQNEDFGFNRLLILSGAKINYSDKITYMWKFNTNSITRRNNYEYDYTGLFGYMYNVLWVLNESIKRKYSSNLIGELAYENLTFMYINYTLFKNNKDLSSLLHDCKKVLEIYNKNRIENESQIFNNTYNKYCYKINNNASISFSEFLDILKKEY